MSKFQNYLEKLDITSTITKEDIEKTVALLNLYAPTLRRAGHNIYEMEEECFENRRQSVSDFINLAIDYDRDTDRKRIADRLSEMGHSMQLLEVMEEALLLVKADPHHGGIYFDILLSLGISSSTYYRHIKAAIKIYAANLWCVVIPDLIITEQRLTAEESKSESKVRVS